MSESIRRGFLANLPVAASVGAYGSVLGVLAAQKGLGWLALALMNVSVFAGSAQFVMVEMWGTPLPIFEMTMAVMVINLRYLLIGASLRPLFAGKSLGHKFARMHLVADENWAVTMAEYRKCGTDTGFLLGGGLCVVTAWSAGTLIGHRLGAFVTHPEAFALDFAFVAVFTALAASLFEGKRDILPWLVAAAAAIATELFFPGKWYIITGGMAGALVAMLTQPEREVAHVS